MKLYFYVIHFEANVDKFSYIYEISGARIFMCVSDIVFYQVEHIHHRICVFKEYYNNKKFVLPIQIKIKNK